MVQMITGHGSFGSYLYRIEKFDTDRYPHCDEGWADTADHTVQECPVWSQERGELIRVVGADLSLAWIMEKISDSRDSWRAFVRFSEGVMRQKEEYERNRQREERDGGLTLGTVRSESPTSEGSAETSGNM